MPDDDKPRRAATRMSPKKPDGSAPDKVRDHHVLEWSSGERGGGKVPADLEWGTNPKQWQEEHGAAVPEKKKE
jgi:hypothetical protein